MFFVFSPLQHTLPDHFSTDMAPARSSKTASAKKSATSRSRSRGSTSEKVSLVGTCKTFSNDICSELRGTCNRNNIKPMFQLLYCMLMTRRCNAAARIVTKLTNNGNKIGSVTDLSFGHVLSNDEK